MKTVVSIVLFLSCASAALGQGFSVQGLQGNSGPRPNKPPKKFLPTSGVAKAGKLQISVASIATATVEGKDGTANERMQIKLSVKNTDTKKRIPFGTLYPTVKDDNGNDYSVTSVKGPDSDSFDPGDTATLVVNVELSAMKAKALRMVLDDGIGWEFKQSDWAKSP